VHPTRDFGLSVVTPAPLSTPIEMLPKIGRTPHTPSFTEYLRRFLAAGCPKPIGFPRKSGGWGVKPFGHGKSSNPEKVLKYSVNTRRFGDA